MAQQELIQDDDDDEHADLAKLLLMSVRQMIIKFNPNSCTKSDMQIDEAALI